MESFAGKIRFIKDGTTAEENLCGNPKLANSEFVRVGYCGNNFNEILRSFVTLVELTVVNQWHNILYVSIRSKLQKLCPTQSRYLAKFYALVQKSPKT